MKQVTINKPLKPKQLVVLINELPKDQVCVISVPFATPYDMDILRGLLGAMKAGDHILTNKPIELFTVDKLKEIVAKMEEVSNEPK